MRRFPVWILGGMFSAALCAGELLNVNSSMELGIPGRGVPGFSYYIHMLDKHEAGKNQEKIYSVQTVGNGNPGKCMKIPGYRGVSRYRIELADFYLKRAGEIVISFDVKMGPGEDGRLHPENNYTIGLRCNADADRDSYYPLLTGFSFRPTEQWQRFSRTFKVKPYSCFYAVWICTPDIPQNGTPNTLYFDNFRVEYTDGATPYDGEYVVMPNRRDQVYLQDAPVQLTVRALLPAEKSAVVRGVLGIKRTFDRSIWKTFPLELKREAGDLFVGSVSFPATEFGAFFSELQLEKRKLATLESPFLVMHPRVKHAAGSPGYGLGINGGLLATDTAGGEYRNIAISQNGFSRSYRLLADSGVNMVRIWGHWRKLEYAEGKFDRTLMELEVAQLKKNDQIPLFVVGGTMHFFNGNALANSLINGTCTFPEYITRYVGKSGSKALDPVNPPMPVFERYLDFVTKHWGDRISIWEIFNEPSVGVWMAEDYIRYLRAAHTFLKKFDPNCIVLGNDVTGDFGLNVVKWCEKLNEVDPNYVDYLDGIAFHPYDTGLDYLNGVRNRYRDCTVNIRRLTRNKPLWNTECYYLQTAYRKQVNNYILKADFGANEILRHYLDGLFHGVVAAPSVSGDSLWNRPQNNVDLISLNENAAALNALSFLLKDMVFPCREVDLGNNLRAGIFCSRDGRKALGFLYDFRIGGSKWVPGDNPHCRILDLYGNDRTGQKALQLRFEPYFITGKPRDVQKLLENSRFELEKTIAFHARRCGGDLYLEGRNLTGLPCESEVDFAGRKLHYSFKQNVAGNTLLLKNFQETLPEGVKLVSERSATLPAEFRLEQGSVIRMWEKDGNLHLHCRVREAEPKATPDDALWNGSCIEVFFDPDPVRNLELDKFKSHQYVFAVVPAADGTKQLATRHAGTAAERTVTRTADGYTMEIRIPLSELPPRDLYGFEVEICRAGNHYRKETLGGKSGQSFQRRLHYTLIRIPSRQLLKNSDFSSVSYGDPENWNYTLAADTSLEAGKRGVILQRKRSAVAPFVIMQKVEIPKGKFKRAIFQVTLAFDGVVATAARRGNAGVLIGLSSVNGKGVQYGKDYLKRDLTGSRTLQTYQLEMELTDTMDFLQVRLGLGENTIGRVRITDTELRLEQE